MSFERILACVDTEAGRHHALEQALRLAEGGGVAIRLVDVVSPPPALQRWLSPERPRLAELAVEEASRQLEALAEPHRAAGLDIETEVLVGTPFLEIIRAARRSGCDLVLEAASADGAGGLFGSTGLHLVRKCPVPVWLVEPRSRRYRCRVLAAIDTRSDSAHQVELNRRIVRHAAELARREDGELWIAQAWEVFGESLLRGRARMPDPELRAYVAEVRRSARSSLDDFLAENLPQIEPHQVLFLKGDPADVLLRVAHERRINLIVMGTVGRGGVAGLLIGNTAERLIGRARCSVLAVKPEGFVSPVPAD